MHAKAKKMRVLSGSADHLNTNNIPLGSCVGNEKGEKLCWLHNSSSCKPWVALIRAENPPASRSTEGYSCLKSGLQVGVEHSGCFLYPTPRGVQARFVLLVTRNSNQTSPWTHLLPQDIPSSRWKLAHVAVPQMELVTVKLNTSEDLDRWCKGNLKTKWRACHLLSLPAAEVICKLLPTPPPSPAWIYEQKHRHTILATEPFCHSPCSHSSKKNAS